MNENVFRVSYLENGETKVLPLDKPRFVIGRADTCDLRFAETEGMSRQHASITNENGVWLLTDMGSRNGTFVNKNKITGPHRLQDNDRIIMGEQVVTFQAPIRTVSRAPASPGAGAKPGLEIEPAKPGKSSANVTSMINMDQMSKLLGGRRGDSGSSLLGTVKSGKVEIEEEKAAQGAWVISLFQQAGEALLQSEDLDKLFDKVMSLVFRNLPAERGAICLYDSQAGKIQPKIMRKRDGKSEGIKISSSIVHEVIKAKNSVLVADAQSDDKFSGAVSIMQMQIKSAMCAPLYHDGKVSGFIYVDSQAGIDPFDDQDLQVLTALALLSAVGVEQTRLREDIIKEQKIRERLARYSSPAVVDQIVANTGAFSADMVAEDREATVVFSDLSGFTSMSENMAPGDVARVLNGIFEGLTDAIFRYDGTLDKYMGDGMMAIFGAPLAQPDHAYSAIRAAMIMFEKLELFNRSSGSEKKVTMRVGINSGRVVAGDIGSPKRKDYTVIGDTVNVASRLESSVAKPGDIVIGPLTYERVKDRVRCEPLPDIKLKGKQISIQPYKVLGLVNEIEMTRPIDRQG